MADERSFRYRILNRYGDVLDISHRRYMPDLPGGDRSYTKIPRVDQGGSVLLGDGHVRGRKLTLKFDQAVPTVEDGYLMLNTLASFFRRQDAPFYCENIERQSRVRVYGEFKPKHMQGNEFRIFKDCTIELDMLDSLWEDITPSSFGPVLMSDGDVLAINTSSFTVPAYCEDIFPIIRITAQADSDLIFSLETGNLNDDSSFSVFRSILVSELTFTTGKVITLDSETGKAYLDGNINQDMVAFGYPLKFDRRNLFLRYNSQSGLGTVSIAGDLRLRTYY